MQHITGTSKNTAGRRLGLVVVAILAVPAQLRAQVVEPAPGVDAATCAPAELTALQTELARARQEIVALRATGMEMQQSLEARDAALADLRSRNAALMAAADERAQAPADVAVRSEPPSPEAAPVVAELAAVKSPASASVEQADPTDVPTAAEHTPALLANVPGVELMPDGRLILTGAALFPPGQAQLSPDGREDLQAVAARLRQAIAAFPAGLAWTLHVDGHTDDTPIHVSGFASNTALSVARAQAVADYLASRGLPAARLAVGGFGATRPLVPGSSPADRTRNRRIELRLTFP